MNLVNIKYEKNSFDNITNPKYRKIESFLSKGQSRKSAERAERKEVNRSEKTILKLDRLMCPCILKINRKGGN
jgi:hypothetical protein